MFNIGDKVVIVKRVDDKIGWDSSFPCEGMMHALMAAKSVGDVSDNHRIYNNTSVIGVKFVGASWNFQPECLQLADEYAAELAGKLPKTGEPGILKKKPVKAVKAKKPKAKKHPKINIRKKFHEHLKAGNGRGLCAVAYEFEDGYTYIEDYMACHAPLGYGVRMGDYYQNNGKKSDVCTKLILGASYQHSIIPDKNKEAHKRFLKYMMQESPWRHTFKTKLVHIALNHEIEMDVSHSRHQVVGAAITMRMASENNYVNLEVFQKLIDDKINPHIAFLLSYLYNITKAGNYVEGQTGGGHQGLNGSMNVSHLMRFFAHGYFLDVNKEPFSTNHTNYQVQCWIANNTIVDPIKSFCQKSVKQTRIGEGWKEEKVIKHQDMLALAKILETKLAEEALKEYK